MRINVYAEELTQDIEVVTKVVDGRTFYAVRLFLKSPPELHHTVEDDDRSAITLWVPWKNGKNNHEYLITIMYLLVDAAKTAKELDQQQGGDHGR